MYRLDFGGYTPPSENYRTVPVPVQRHRGEPGSGTVDGVLVSLDGCEVRWCDPCALVRAPRVPSPLASPVSPRACVPSVFRLPPMCLLGIHVPVPSVPRVSPVCVPAPPRVF